MENTEFGISLVCLKRSSDESFETLSRVQIHRIRAGTSKIKLAFWDILMSTFFIHLYFYFAAKKIIKKKDIKILHVHDLPLMGTALLLKRKYKHLRVVFDMHENYPEALPLWFGWKKGLITQLKNRLFMTTNRWLPWEKKAVAGADAILTVVDEMKSTLERKYGPLPKAVVVSNTESISFLNTPVDASVYSSFPDKFIITYTGGIGPHRGIDTVVDAMALISNPEIIFVVVGSGSKDAMTELQQRINKLQLQDRIFLLGHRPASTVLSYMTGASANIIPHKKNAQNDNGVPHKLFQNMLAGRPLLVSSSAPLQRIVHETKSGLVFEAENPRELAEAIMQLYHSPSLASELAQNGRTAASSGKYAWETSAKTLRSVYDHLSKRGE